MMNILQINNYSYRKGGSETHFLNLIELLKLKGHEVITFSSESNKRHFLNFSAAKTLQKLLDNQKIDIAHIHNINHQLSPLILKILKQNNIPVVMTVHDYSLISANYNLYLQNKLSFKNIILTIEFYLRRFLFPYNKLVNIFIAPSKFMAQKLKSKGFKNIVTINNFTKLVDDEVDPHDYFLYFGRLSKEKGLKEFIKTLSKVEKDFKFYIAGDGPEKNKLIKLVKNLNLNQKIKFLGYQDRDTELFQLINDAQFVIIPSLCQENCSLSILESMAHGKIVLAPNLGGNSELINNQNGFLYNFNDETNLLDKINILIDNKESNWKIGERAKRDIQEKFNPENYYQKLIQIYKFVIKQ